VYVSTTGTGVDRSWIRYFLLWLAGIDLRITMLAVPPVLPLIHRDLRLSETAIAILTGLPVVLLAVAALPGSLLIARLGARRATVTGIFVVAAASGLRGVGPSLPALLGMTFLMALGIAITQPAMPSLVDRWFPRQVGLATAVYVNGILIGEALSASLTLPLVLPLTGGRWPWTFAFWGLLVLVTGAVMAWLTPSLPDVVGSVENEWLPDWTKPQTWLLGFLQGGASAAYFGSNAFIPDFLHAIGRPNLVGACLTVLNAGQLPASAVALLIAPRIVGRRLPFLIAAAAVLVGLAVFLLPGDWGPVAGSGILGFFLAITLVLMLALPPLLAEPGGVHRLSAGMFSMGYLMAFTLSLVGGALWDLTHVTVISFFPVAAGAVTIFAAASVLPVERYSRTDRPLPQADR
jgi:MFS transporter, CP family, cyanate transporter